MSFLVFYLEVCNILWKLFGAGSLIEQLCCVANRWNNGKWNGFLCYWILVPKCGLIFLKIWNLFCLIHFENNIKTSCYPAKIPVHFRFICLSLFCNIALMPVFSLLSFTSTVVHPTILYIGMLFSHGVLLFCCLFYLTLTDAFCCFSFIACESSSIQNLFVLTIGLAENLNQMVFRQTFVIQHVRTRSLKCTT